MKILQINNLHFRKGGADVVYLNTGKLLEENNHKVLYFSSKNIQNERSNFDKYFVSSKNFIEYSFLNKITTFSNFFYSFETIKKLKRLINDHKPDIAHLHLYKGNLTTSILPVLKSNKIPIIITLHDYSLIDPHNLLLDGNLNIFEKTINGSAFNSVLAKSNRNSYFYSFISTLEYLFHFHFFPFNKYFDRVLAVSKFARDKNLESKKIDFQVNYLYNFIPFLNQIKPIFSFDSYFLYIGRLSKEKGIETLIEAWLKINSDKVLKIVGTGPLLKNYKNKSFKNIEFLGYKTGSELINIINNCSFVIVPSIVYETGPLTVAEAYSLGKPVIGSDIGGISEIVIHNRTGYTFKYGDPIDLSKKIFKSLNLNKSTYENMSENCLHFANKTFCKKIHYKELIEHYNKTIEHYE